MSTWYIALSILYSAVFLVFSARHERPAPSVLSPKSVNLVRKLFYLSFLYAIVRQIYLCRFGFFSLPSADEYAFARIYTAAIGAGRPIYGGFSQGVMATIFNIWYAVFGPSLVTIRALASVLGLVGILLYLELARKEFGNFVAYLGSTFLCWSTYFLLFASVALEVTAVFFFAPLCLLFLRHFSFRGARPIGGVLLALSIFTYPGMTLGWAAMATACLLNSPKACWLFLKRRANFLVLLTFGVTFLCLTGLNFYFNAPPGLYSLRPKLFQGGGSFLSERWEAINIFFTNITDAFVGGSSWYVEIFPYATFLEQSLWGAFLLGAHTNFKNPRYRPLLLTAGIAFLTNFLITDNPGLRRIIAVLPILYFVAAEALSKQRLFRVNLTVLLLLLAWNGLWLAPYALKNYPPIRTPAMIMIPDEPLLDTLARGDVFLDATEFSDSQAQLAAQARRELEVRYGNRKNLGKIIVGTLEQTKNATPLYQLTWDKKAGGDIIFTFRFMELRRIYRGR